MNFRDKQIDHAIYKELITNWDQATSLPKEIREQLKMDRPLDIKAELFDSNDKRTQKALITFADQASVETVLMKYDGRNTICVSSQIGCAMGCKFCKTGTMGLIRNLTKDEIVTQVLFFARLLKDTNESIDNIVFMGMGEPLLNYDNVIESIRIINDSNKLNIGARHISISTCGIINGIEKLANENIQINLALSLHAPNEQLRSKLMPINDKQPLAKVIQAIIAYIKKTNRKVMFEYLMINDVNDGIDQAKELINLIGHNPLIMVNLIPYNPTGIFKTSPAKKITEFKSVLVNNGVMATQRFSFGQDINAACGQLATKARENI